MKKDGILEKMKSSRLSIYSEDSTSIQTSHRNVSESNKIDSSTPKHDRDDERHADDGMDTGGSTLTNSETNGSDVPRTIFDARTVKVPAKDGLRGVPKSGRIWKRVRSERFSSIKYDKPDRTTWTHKQGKKAEIAAVKSFAQQVKEEKNERQKAERERIEENKKRKLENEKKNEIVVPIKNVAKMKRMRKKQLRSIEKR